MLTKAERLTIRGRLLRAKLAARKPRTEAQKAASKANLDKAHKALRYKRSKMWW